MKKIPYIILLYAKVVLEREIYTTAVIITSTTMLLWPFFVSYPLDAAEWAYWIVGNLFENAYEVDFDLYKITGALLHYLFFAIKYIFTYVFWYLCYFICF